MLNTLSVAFPQVTRGVTGQYLAKNRLSKRDRAELAARIISGAVEIENLTYTQVAALCNVSVASIALVRNGGRKPARRRAPATLAAAWATASECERTESLLQVRA